MKYDNPKPKYMKNNSHSSSSILSTNGLSVPLDFPTVQYESINTIISTTQAGNSLYAHFSGSWNALAYRFRAAIDYGNIFVESLKNYGDSPPPEERYVQERTLYGLFSSGFSVFESTFYGLYTIGAFLKPNIFPLSTREDQKNVTPAKTYDKYVRAFITDPILTNLDAVLSDLEYQQWRENRNILTHRTAPGRIIYGSMSKKDSPPAIWKLNDKPIDETISTSNRKELSRMLTNLLGASLDFVERKFTKK